MLCNLAVRLTEDGSYLLRVSGRTAQGPSDTGGRDVKEYPTVDGLLSDLGTLGLDWDVISAATRVLKAPETRQRFINFAESVQISFEVIERADIHLFD
jgi:hypothetical protein